VGFVGTAFNAASINSETDRLCVWGIIEATIDRNECSGNVCA
jgi:hypothetical protein